MLVNRPVTDATDAVIQCCKHPIRATLGPTFTDRLTNVSPAHDAPLADGRWRQRSVLSRLLPLARLLERGAVMGKGNTSSGASGRRRCWGGRARVPGGLQWAMWGGRRARMWVSLGNAETLEDDLSEGGDNSSQHQTGMEWTVARFHAIADMFIARDVEQDEPTTDGPQVKRAAYAVQGQLILASKGAGKTMEPPFLPAVRTRLACLRLQMRLAQGQ
ncbi:uncharacterized protein CLUP02_03085 [Colletotrichum lupini]|uniref:Uncharacterized protein n=2 Tax=Colletotrichum acutatum species complex TaxID=2707335 RepID=A0A9Q8WBZ9_9PEZI|nr:uncharacterized protein CLUP02_03085 [Colletotrichum lupini]XP_060318950.1 uncharacterized protein CCOS01_02108 [Colletotrichum costaricense]KAK1536788.1 hypothetical protein CCOS01_02108 [Colletotrichum costaricense]UQC77616.1 hypothetical protein CLUP02_03085 [Colletotrichum lupini]